MKNLKRAGQFILSLIIVFSAGGLGSLGTMPNIPKWYEGLDKPPLLPPNSVFGPVWGVIYLMIAIALFLVWVLPKKEKKDTPLIYVAFFTQLVLNTLWSVAFFGLQMPWLALIVILLLIFAIIWTMREFYKVSVYAFGLFVPYILWVLFATYLTLGVAILN